MRQVALFRLGSELFAVNGNVVAHIVVTPQIFQLPLMCPEIFGIFVRDEQPVYLFDLFKVYNLSFDLTLDMAEHVLICRSEAGQVGLPATVLERIVPVESGVLEKAAQVDFSQMQYEFIFDDQKYQLVDVDTLVAALLR
ncbi:MAG: chemotaxis protein CheW [Desulfuromonadales bacterium]|nr:chemotaxis protein CheW [Desulfuromonadales bacterium]MDT8422687.1 chemotaxis protein CheW [Desulfuromonadales bacterium]